MRDRRGGRGRSLPEVELVIVAAFTQGPPPNRAGLAGLARARAALESDEPGPTGDEAIAECERRRREASAKDAGLRGLPLFEQDPE